MSLLRLLTTGKSLVGLKKSESRYHLPGDRALPKFGSKKNPFRATVIPEKAESAQAGEAPVGGSECIQVGAAGERSGLQTAAGAENGAVHKDSSPAIGGKHNATTQEPENVLDKPARRTTAVRAFLLWGRAKKVKPSGARTNRPMVQGELSLDSVRVVRNDLSESDLEVVRVSPAAAPKSAGPKLVESEPGWGAAAGRLFGLGKL